MSVSQSRTYGWRFTISVWRNMNMTKDAGENLSILERFVHKLGYACLVSILQTIKTRNITDGCNLIFRLFLSFLLNVFLYYPCTLSSFPSLVLTYWLVLWTPGGEVWVLDLLGSMCCVLRKNTRLSQFLSLPRGLNGYRLIFREAWWNAKGYNLAIDWHPTRLGGGRFASCLENRDKLWVLGPSGSTRGLTLFFIFPSLPRYQYNLLFSLNDHFSVLPFFLSLFFYKQPIVDYFGWPSIYDVIS